MLVTNEIIRFESKDFLPRDMQYFKRSTMQIAHTINKYPNFLDALADFLFTFIDKISFNKRYEEWKRVLLPIDIYYGKEISENFLSDLYNTFNNLKDYHVDKFRGLLF